MKNQIILASHGGLAAGMRAAAEFFGAQNIEILEQTLEDTGFERKAEALLKKHEDKNCIVFTDLYGGSVNQIFSRELQRSSFHLVTGMNLAIVLECAFTDELIDGEFLKRAVETSKQQFCYMNELLAQMMREEDDE